MQKLYTVALAAAAGLAFAAVPAGSTTKQCIREARSTKNECNKDCREAFQQAKDGCKGKDHDCVEICRANRHACREGFEAAIDACNQTLEDAAAACRAQYGAGTPERDACIDQAQLVAFQCRDAAREQFRAALKQCRMDFRTCVAACPDVGQPEDPMQCRLDAIAAYKACTAVCKEDFQVAKDACLNRDHTCVEACRVTRANCRQPIIDTLRAAVAACKADRDAEVANCHVLYGEGTPELDQCIDNAQVANFQCRDDAHEAARPGLAQCRADFRTCAEACPPPPAP